MSLNVSLPVELEKRVRDHVASGLYGSASEVIREALRLFESVQEVQHAHLNALKSDVAIGLADVSAGCRGQVISYKKIGREVIQAVEG